MMNKIEKVVVNYLIPSSKQFGPWTSCTTLLYWAVVSCDGWDCTIVKAFNEHCSFKSNKNQEKK